MIFTYDKKNTQAFYSKLKEMGLDNDAEKLINFDSSLSKDAIDALMELSIQLLDTKAEAACVKLKMLNDSNDHVTLESLKGFESAVVNLISTNTLDGWLYRIDDDNFCIPYLLTSVVHFIANVRTGERAKVSLFLIYNCPKSNTENRCEFEFYLSDVSGSTVVSILASKGLYKETAALQARYNKQLELYEQYAHQVGSQFLGNGILKMGNTIYNANSRRCTNEKLVIDEDLNVLRLLRKTTRACVLNSKRTELSLKNSDDINNEPIEILDFRLPFHAFIKMYSLSYHESVWMLADQITPYVYNTSLDEKLVLPEDHKDLIDVLINDSEIVLGDIVGNKSGGTVVLATGSPGVGKTLTAEVYAERIQKPLYSVHAGQLGINQEQIEAKLQAILKNAERWNAILLLDEADVYIRRRDNDMSHSAIVATFLRCIERYNGILFITTNRAQDIDEAIISRCSSIIKYESPSKQDLFKIWKILSKHYKVEMSDMLIHSIIESVEGMVGRDVKELLKLATRFRSQRGIEIDYDVIRKCSIYRGLPFKDSRSK